MKPKIYYKKHTNNEYSFTEICSPLSIKNTVALQYNTGSIADEKGKEGTAHLVEHLLTRAGKANTGQLEMEVRGVNTYAFTYRERTIYNASSYLLSVDSVFSELLNSFNTKPSKEDLQEEIKTIGSEISEDKANKNKIIYNTVMSKCTKVSGISKKYKNAVAGTASSIKNISLNNVHGFIDMHYRNPVIAVTSSIRLTAKQIGNIFSLISKNSILSSNIKPLNKIEDESNFPIEKLKSAQFDFKIKNTQVYGVCLSNINTKRECVYFGLLKQYLAGNWSSICNQRMRVTKQLTYFVYGNMSVFRNFACMHLTYDVLGNHEVKAKAAYRQIMQEIKEGRISEDLFVAAKNMRIANVSATFKNEDDLIDDFLVSNNNPTEKKLYTLEDYLTAVRGVKLKDFRNYAKRIFTSNSK